MQVAVLVIYLGKNSCGIVGIDETGKVVVRRRMQRPMAIAFAANLDRCIVATEACCGAHYMSWALAAQGHTVRLMSWEFARPYVNAQKKDDRDAEAIAEAATGRRCTSSSSSARTSSTWRRCTAYATSWSASARR